MDPNQPTLDGIAFNLKKPRGLCTPRAFINALFDSSQYDDRTLRSYGVETWADKYAEPGYTDPKLGILFGNWNDPDHKWNGKSKPERFSKIAEYAGYAIEWYDEWSQCDDCGKAVRTSPDSYSWQSSYVLVDDCSIICHECIDWSEVLERYEDDPHKAVVSACDPSEYGYTLVSGPREYESGFHQGQTDDPKQILKDLHARGHKRIVFRVPETSQFYIRFEAWERKPDEDQGFTCDECGEFIEFDDLDHSKDWQHKITCSEHPEFRDPED